VLPKIRRGDPPLEAFSLATAGSCLAPFVGTVLERVGVPPADARTVADTLVGADLRGVHSHGVMRLPNYVKRNSGRPGQRDTTLEVTPCAWAGG
jgi:LDH2 family malate/lactate/ureidoglycolate dehydrogenase